MTVEELEIVVSASIEPALKEIKKLMPQIKQQVTQAVESAQKAMEQIDMKKTANKVQQAIQVVKKKIDNLKKSNEKNDISIKVNNQEAQKQISQVERQIDSLQKKISASQMKLNMVTPKLDAIMEQTTKELTPDGISSDNPAIQKTINNSLAENKEYKSLAAQEEKLVQETKLYNDQLDKAKAKLSQLKQETQQAGSNQNKLTNFFGNYKDKLDKAKGSLETLKNVFGKLPNITKNMVGHIKKMGTGLKSGIGHVIKYAGALFSLRSIYNVLSSSAQSWLSSQNSGAQQLSANIEYLKYSMGAVFAPIIQYIINLVYQLMKAIQALVYAFSGINIFAKATASSMNKTAGSASKASKSLAGVHNEINNVSQNDSNGGSGTVSPSMDLSQLDTQMSPFAQKLHDFFKPLVDSWNTYGNGLVEQVKTTASQISGLIASVWGSFENIITNGTVYHVLQNILSIIGNISEAFSNAWNYNGNGDIIVQNLANAFNNLFIAIDNVVKSEGFQEFLKNCSEKFAVISEKISQIDWQPLLNAISQVGSSIGEIALDIVSGLVSVFKWLVENPIVAELLLGIAIAIGVVSTAISILSTVLFILEAGLLPIIGIILAIIAVIALVVVAIMNWESIMNWLKETVQTVINAVVEFFTNLWSKVSFVFEAIWEVISTKLGFIWNIFAIVFEAVWSIVSTIFSSIWSVISTILEAIWNIISTALSSIWNVFSQIFNWIWQLVSKVFQGIWNVISPIINKVWDTIKIVLGKIQEVWSNIWNGIKNTVVNIWNGIWSCIKAVINSILSGIENMVNGVIRGVNFILGGISSIANAVGSLIGLDPINLRLSYVSLPRLAKGNVAYSETMAIFGEYAGASTNPEITTPQNIMRETFDEVLSNHEWNNNSEGTGLEKLEIHFGSTKIALEIERLLQQARRQNGIATVTI